jgi:DNA invertase Pin-like site-specific DNA recombinase
MDAVGYLRESAGRPPLAEQNRAFLEYCRREEFEPAGTFADGESSSTRAPGFRKLLEHLRGAGGTQVAVVVPSIETLADDLAAAIGRSLQIENLGGRVVAMDGAGSGDVATDILAAWTSRDDSTRLGERVRAAMRRKAVQGEVLGRPPYGYKVGNRRRLELVPEEAVVVRYIFRLYLQEGLGIRLIARRLNGEGLKTRRGGNWSMVSIRDILRNRAYLGTYARFGVRVPGNHPALVSADDFRLVQDRLNARRTTSQQRTTTRFLLSGMAYCGSCGNKLIGVSRKQSWTRKDGERVENSYRYYQCESRTNQSICDYHTRRAGELEAAVRRRITETLGAADLPAADEAVVLAEEEHERDRLRSRMRSIDRRIERYVEAAVKGRVTKDRMHTKSVGAAADRLAVEDALEAVERRIGQPLAAGDRRQQRQRQLEQLVSGWDKLVFNERQRLLREGVSRITVTDSGVTLALRP